jgi:hypothetical protein
VSLTGRDGSTPFSRTQTAITDHSAAIARIPVQPQTSQAVDGRLPRCLYVQIQEWMDHRDYRTTLIYAGYEPGDEQLPSLLAE